MRIEHVAMYVNDLEKALAETEQLVPDKLLLLLERYHSFKKE